jgi:hypothetical protein
MRSKSIADIIEESRRLRRELASDEIVQAYKPHVVAAGQQTLAACREVAVPNWDEVACQAARLYTLDTPVTDLDRKGIATFLVTMRAALDEMEASAQMWEAHCTSLILGYSTEEIN